MGYKPFRKTHAWQSTIWIFVWVTTLFAGEAQYTYDYLGRLSAVVDEAGNTALYNYDAVGNLLAIDRFTASGSGIGIFTLLPARGAIGSQVKIQGYGFSTTPSNNTVTFNGTTATVVSSTAYAIVATVPSGTTTGTVAVTNTNGTATSAQAFTVLGAPTITSITPATVGQGTKVPVAIVGTGLAHATGVSFSHTGLSATIRTGVTDTTLPITLLVAATVPAGTYTFTVTTPLGTANSGTVIIGVAAGTPAFVHAKSHVSVWLPSRPSGSMMSVGSSTSTIRSGGALSGTTMTVDKASQILPSNGALSGSTMTVAPPVSESMP